MGMGGFLQTSAGQVVNQLSIDIDMSGVNLEILTHFMEAKIGYASASGEIVGILKTMHDEITGQSQKTRQLPLSMSLLQLRPRR